MPNTDTSPQILCVGRIYCDLVFSGVSRMPSLGSEVFAENVTLHAGGGAFNTASAFSALGRRTALCGVLPAAPFQDQILQEGRSMDLDLSLCVPAGVDASPQITVAIALQGDRSFLSQKSGDAFPCPDLSAPVCRSVKHLHIGELNSLCETPEILDLARQAGWTVSLDCSWDDALLRQVMEKLFRDKRTPLSPGVLEYLLDRMERSVDYARRLTAWLDREALARKGPVTRTLAREGLSVLSS